MRSRHFRLRFNRTGLEVRPQALVAQPVPTLLKIRITFTTDFDEKYARLSNDYLLFNLSNLARVEFAFPLRHFPTQEVIYAVDQEYGDPDSVLLMTRPKVLRVNPNSTFAIDQVVDARVLVSCVLFHGSSVHQAHDRELRYWLLFHIILRLTNKPLLTD